MAMRRTIILIFICTAVERDTGKYIYVSLSKTWVEAQAYCRQYYTDLSFFSTISEYESLLKSAGPEPLLGYIGLYRSADNASVWMWSGGPAVTYVKWADKQPDYSNHEENVAEIWGKNGTMNDCRGNRNLFFYCIHLPKAEGKMSWEAALEYCRGTKRDLASLMSKEQLLDAQNVIRPDHITDPVWIGLRFLGDQWLWVDGSPLVFEAWPQGDQDHLCPRQKRCGALTKAGVWKNWDCRDVLNVLCI